MSRRRNNWSPNLGKKIVYTVAIGNFSFPPTNDQKKVITILNEECKGILAIYPSPEQRGTLLFFDSLNNAKEARNILQSYGVQTGYNIVEGEFDFDTNTMGEGKKVA